MACHSLGPSPAAADPIPTAATLRSFLGELTGAWSGELMYVDYGSGREVVLPARVRGEAAAGNGVLLSHLTFTDPGYEVRSLDVSWVDASPPGLVSESFDGASSERAEWKVVSSAKTPTGWTLVLSGEGMDNGASVDVRVTRTLEDARFTSTKEVRPRGETDAPWLTRNELRLTRVVPSAADLVGTWRVDLRQTPDAEPYYQEFVVKEAADGTFKGTFYKTKIKEARVNTDWGDLHFAFVTDPGKSPYHTSGRLVDGRLEGTTHSLERNFVSVWSAEKVQE
ncbi:MAG: hypothetical protein HKN12_02845 [Gemmatimonadetes bacterium]|nr:hypothetical protein [Gemmatimonadota bacterium]